MAKWVTNYLISNTFLRELMRENMQNIHHQLFFKKKRTKRKCSESHIMIRIKHAFNMKILVIWCICAF